MRIGYLVPEFPSQTHVFFWREVEALRRLEAEVHLISTRRPRPNACPHDFGEPAARETHYVFPPRWGAALAALAVRPLGVLSCLAYLASLRETPIKKRLVNIGLILAAAELLVHSREHGLEHIHGQSCADSAHLLALCHRLGGPPYGLTLHGDLPVYGVDHASKMADARFIACVTSQLQQQVMTTLKISRERLPLVIMGVDTDRFRNDGCRQAQAGRLHLVMVSRLNPTKGHRHALAAVRRAVDAGCDIQFSIAGEGPSRKQIEEEISRLGLDDRVQLAGTLSENEVLRLLQRADAFVLSSIGLGESGPVAVKEAMACGLPVVCSIIGGTTDMITSGVDGILVEQADERALAEAFIRLANDPAERARLGAAARSRAVQAFDSRQTARSLFDAIRRSLDSES